MYEIETENMWEKTKEVKKINTNGILCIYFSQINTVIIERNKYYSHILFTIITAYKPLMYHTEIL